MSPKESHTRRASAVRKYKTRTTEMCSRIASIRFVMYLMWIRCTFKYTSQYRLKPRRSRSIRFDELQDLSPLCSLDQPPAKARLKPEVISTIFCKHAHRDKFTKMVANKLCLLYDKFLRGPSCFFVSFALLHFFASLPQNPLKWKKATSSSHLFTVNLCLIAKQRSDIL